MVKSASAFSPGHVTGLFYMTDSSRDILNSGSLGSGFSLEKGTVTKITERTHGDKHLIKINGEVTAEASVTRIALKLFFAESGISGNPLEISHTISVPIGAGFGTSGSGALSLTYALNNFFGEPLTQIRAAQIAHIAEIQCQTGLGTVLGETIGGFKISTVPGAPGIGRAVNIPHPKDTRVAFIVFGPYSTSEALNNPVIRAKIIKNGKRYYNEIRENPSLENFISYSRDFAESSGIISPLVRDVLNELEKHKLPGSMLMFGEGTFTIFNGEQAEEINRIFKKIVSKFNLKRPPVFFISNISEKGAEILYES
jgi:pantoate kinase